MSFTKRELEAIALLQPVTASANVNTVDMDALIAKAHQLRSAYVRSLMSAAAAKIAAAYKTRRDYSKAVSTLHAMSNRELADIGLSRSEIETAVRGHMPAKVTLAQKIAGKLAPLAKRYADWRSRRQGYAQLMAMDLRQLSDIGLTRGEIEAAVAGKGSLANDNVALAANNNASGRQVS